MGDYRVKVEVKGSDVEVSWFDGKGKSLKSVPAPVKKEHAEDWKDLQGDIKDLQAMISAQKERIDGLFLEQKTWPAGVWRERYIDHPVVGTIGRRLIWCVDGVAVTMIEGQAQDLEAQTSCHCRCFDGHPVASCGPKRRRGGGVAATHRIARHGAAVQAGAPRSLPGNRCRAAYRALFQPVRGAYPSPTPIQCTVRRAALEEQAPADGR